MAKDIEDKINKIISRIEKLENVVFNKDTPIVTKNKKKYEGITGGIKFLIDSGYLNTLKSSKEIHEELRKEGYYHRKEAVDTILRRDFVGSKKILTRDKEDKFWKYVIRK